MKILLVGGFLGSGKTSFILKLAHHMIDDLGISNIVILENEIGEISVDDKVLKGSGYQVKGLFIKNDKMMLWFRLSKFSPKIRLAKPVPASFIPGMAPFIRLYLCR